jgi:hypothetical protein
MFKIYVSHPAPGMYNGELWLVDKQSPVSKQSADMLCCLPADTAAKARGRAQALLTRIRNTVMEDKQ